MVIYVAADCKSDSRKGNMKQQWLIKTKRKNIQLIQHVRMCHTFCFG